MTSRHTAKRMKIAIYDHDLLISWAVPAEGGDVQAAIAAEGARAGFSFVSDEDLGNAEREPRQFDPGPVEIHEVYLSDVEYLGPFAVFTSGHQGQLQTDDYNFAYAYDADEVDAAAAKFAQENGTEVGRLLYNLQYETDISGNVANDWQEPFRAGTLPAMDVLEMERAMDLRPDVDSYVSDYVSGADAQPSWDEVIEGLAERELVPEYDFWVCDPFVVMLAAVAVDAIDDQDLGEEEAKAALKACDEDLFVVGRDPANNHKIKVGREIDDGRAYVNVRWFDNYRAIVDWASNFDGFEDRDAA